MGVVSNLLDDPRSDIAGLLGPYYDRLFFDILTVRLAR